MTHIHKLPQSEVDRICAGEVVERPASAVKELVENSLDAGATRIEVTIEDGGKRLISVSDNGAGIPSSELELALSQHCTSKIERADDLYSKHTLGFRGEALYSIAAVSKTRVTSRREDEVTGASIFVEAAEIKERKKLAFNVGTHVEVRELFFNTPVRRKFLKSKNSEVSFITSLILEYALAYPEVSWRFTSDGREIVGLDCAGDPGRVLVRVYDEKIAAELVGISFEFYPGLSSGEGVMSRADALSISGVIALPHNHKSTRSGQFFFVNRRPVRNKIFFRAVDDAFREHMSPGKHGLCVLMIDIPPGELDVNIHPSKLEIDFSNSQQVYGLIIVAIKRALAESASAKRVKIARELGIDSVPEPFQFDDATTASPDSPEVLLDYVRGAETGGTGDDSRLFAPEADIFAERPRVRAVPLYVQSREPGETPQRAAYAQPSGKLEKDGAIDVSSSEIEEIRNATLLGQIGRSFLAIASQNALFLVDQHSAHERILFEILYRDVTGREGGPPRQSLVFPMLANLRTDQAVALDESIPALNRLGFSVELFGENTLLLREIPLVLGSRFTLETFISMLDEVLATGKEYSYNMLVKHIAATAACKAAIKAGDPLTEEESLWLVKSLTNAEDSLSCPHGRPTIIRLGAKEIGRMFQR